MKVHLSSSERRYTIEEGEDSDEPYSYRGIEGIEWEPEYISLDDKGQLDVDFEPLVGTNVFLVTVRYTDGDTFGSTQGHWDIVKVCKTLKEAETIQQGIENKTYIMPSGYCPWDGYFARFERAQVDTIPVVE